MVTSILERRDGHRISLDDERLRRTDLSYALFIEAWNTIPEASLQPGKPLRATIDMERPTGLAVIVRAPLITPTQLASFAQRHNTLHRRPSRVVDLDGRAPQTRHITILGDWHGESELWLIRTAYPGPYVYPQPWDFRAMMNNGLKLNHVLEFWCRAAFLWAGKYFQRIHEDTLAGLIDGAAKAQPKSAAEVGYREVQRRWNPQEAR